MAMQIQGRERRKLRIRRKIEGTPERPRMSVFRSLKHVYAQVVDDTVGKTLAHSSTLAPEVRAARAADGPKGTSGDVKPFANKTDGAKKVGEAIAAQLKAKGITKVVFDRNGYLYHGRIKALAEAARKAGLEF